MNREEKRTFAKKLRKKGKTSEAIEQIISLKEMMSKKGNLNEGQAVRLDIEKIKSHPGWDKMRDTYKEFIESNVNTEFTVEFVDKYPKHQIICLKEDPTVPKWYFWAGDLAPKEDF